MSLSVHERQSLQPFNTFGVAVTARWYAEAGSDAEVREALGAAAARGAELFVIGGGSNLLLTGDLDAFVLRMVSRGRRLLDEADGRVVVEAQAAGVRCLVSASVPPEADVIGALVTRLPLTAGPTVWADHLLALLAPQSRVDAAASLAAVAASPFNMQTAAAELQALWHAGVP